MFLSHSTTYNLPIFALAAKRNMITRKDRVLKIQPFACCKKNLIYLYLIDIQSLRYHIVFCEALLWFLHGRSISIPLAYP